MSALPNRALIVEDDRSWQDILSEILVDSGLVVDLADNLEAAVSSLRNKAHRLAVVDLSLGGIDHHNQDGLRVLDLLHQHDPNCQTIMLTGFATVELAVSALTEHGALTCLRKEKFQRAEFRELIRKVLARVPQKDKAGTQTQGAGKLKTGKGGSPVERRGWTLEDETPASLAALVVEDDAGWRSIFLELLVDAGFRVQLCSGYGEGLGHLRRDKYSLAVVDLSLESSMGFRLAALEDEPDSDHLDGYRLLTSTRALGIPTIVVSGVGTTEDIERAYSEQGIFAYLQKQVFDRNVFLRTIQDALAAAQANSELEQLTDREREVLDLLSQGLTNKEIAEKLVISTNTVKRHLKAIFGKLDIHTRSAAAAKAVSGGVPGERAEGD
jgi:DNA-binding NarL/FixJ family response regulator